VNGSVKGQGLDGRGQGIEVSTVNGAISLKVNGIKGRLNVSTVNGGVTVE